eukprot:366578-Chlamydomonas_euryale.AAC.2
MMRGWRAANRCMRASSVGIEAPIADAVGRCWRHSNDRPAPGEGPVGVAARSGLCARCCRSSAAPSMGRSAHNCGRREQLECITGVRRVTPDFWVTGAWVSSAESTPNNR